jgi:arylsulfatase A-like enzyme
MKTLLAALLLLPLAVLYAADAPELTAKPNLVIIFTDDMGYGDLGCYGGKDIPTPHIDRLAAEGARLTSAYTVAPICVPSRMGLLTGKFPARFGIFTNVYSPFDEFVGITGGMHTFWKGTELARLKDDKYQ